MKHLIKLALILVLSVQSLMAYGAEDMPEDDGEIYYPPVDISNKMPRLPKVCDDCIPFDAVKDQTVSIEGHDWILRSQMKSGDWILGYVGRTEMAVYSGRTADETFGTSTKYSIGNDVAVCWMNAGFGAIDSRLRDLPANNPDKIKITKEVYENTIKESGAVISKVKENIKEKSGNSNSFICPDLECSYALAKLSESLRQPQPVADNGPSDTLGDLYQNLSETEPFAADQVGLSGQYIDDKPYRSSQRAVIEQERERLNESRAQGPHQWDAKVAAFQNLRKADNAYLANDNQAGDDYLKVGRFLTDIATDFIPFTAIPKDLYRALVGKDPLTGQGLSPLERVLAAGFAGLNTFTLGGAGAMAAGIKNIGKAAGATLKEIALAEKLAEIAEKSPLKFEVLVKGTSEEITLIGRDMTRVNEVSAALEKNGIKVNTLNGFSDEARKQWDKLLDAYKELGLRIPNNEVIKSLKYAENEVWIKNALEKGHTILDLGDPAGNVFSPFYNMEKTEILNYLRRAK